ncbi:MAG: hypothetical protein JNJ61_01535 [Anaerolineae bacterium]|nr:hypothetical protein [Anaerolineae bacterium]
MGTLRKSLLTIFVITLTSIHNTSPILGQGGCSKGPTNPDAETDMSVTDLDNDVTFWGGFCDNSKPEWEMVNVQTPTPSGDSQALRCSITGRDKYGKLHCYRNFALTGGVGFAMFTGDFRFKFTSTTCNNLSTSSVIQGIEFTFSQWLRGVRHEFALQWENVTDGSLNDAAPQWRYWNGRAWRPFALPIPECLSGDLTPSANNWHSLRLEGVILGGRAEYRSFIINGTEHELDNLSVGAVSNNQSDHLAIALQLDANSIPDPYDVLLDDVTFVRWPVLLAPAAPTNGSISTDDRPTFTWNTVVNAVQYELQLGVNDPPTTTVYVGSSACYMPPSALLPQGYRWRVRAIDAGGHASPWTRTQSLTIASNSTRPPLRNYYTTATPTLTWTRVSWATEYELEVDSDSRFTAPFVHSTVLPASALSATLPTLADCGYYWRVRARSGNQVGSWSTVERFVVDSG